MSESKKTYLVTYNAKKDWKGLDSLAVQTENGELVYARWNVSNQKVKQDDRLFLLKQGEHPKGIMATGWVASEKVYKQLHYNKEKADIGKQLTYVDAKWDTILNPKIEKLLQVGDIIEVNWNTMSSGILIPEEIADGLEASWKKHVLAIRAPSDELDEMEFPEGKAIYRLHRTLERNSGIRDKVKQRARMSSEKIRCVICNFDFHETYGSVGEDFIECHHTIPVSELRTEMKTKLSDVVMVCSNCHRMLHRRRPWLQVEELKVLLSESKKH
jgi:predicted HNH restriction endonuclease